MAVVEYKSPLMAEGPDTAEKRTVGELWERQSDGACLFLIAESWWTELIHGRRFRAKSGRKGSGCGCGCGDRSEGRAQQLSGGPLPG